MMVSVVQPQRQWRVSEPVLVAAMLLLLLVVNLATSSRFPLPWQDEDVFADVAVNLATDRGFVSSINSCGAASPDPMDHFWSCNAPLFPYLLGNWVRVFGFSIRAVRSLNYILFSLAVLVLWLAVRRLKLIARPSGRVIFVLLLLAGYGMGFIYRSARYDCLTLLLVSLVLLAYAIPSKPMRLAVIGLLGVLFPLAGIQLLCYCAVLGGLLLVFFRREILREIVALALGTVAGVCLLFALFYSHGVLQNFFSGLFIEQRGRFTYFAKDLSYVMLLGAGSVLVLNEFRKRTFRFQSALAAGFVCGLLVPVGMVVLGKFPIYYSWMAYLPLALGVSAGFPELDLQFSKAAYLLSGVCLLLACLFGVPIQLASAAYYWKDRDCARIDTLVQKDMTSNDWVYADYSAYFAARKVTPHVFMPFIIPPRYCGKISVLIVSPEAYAAYAHAIIGGDWYDTGRGIADRGHDLFPNNSFAKLLQRRIDLHVYKRIAAKTSAAPR